MDLRMDRMDGSHHTLLARFVSELDFTATAAKQSCLVKRLLTKTTGFD